MHRELLPLVKEVGKLAFLAASSALADKRLRQNSFTSNFYGIDFTIEDIRKDHGVGTVYPVKQLNKDEPLDIKKDGAILKELGARLYILELENGPTTHHEGVLYCDAPETQLMDMSHQIRTLKSKGFSQVEDLVARVDVPEGFELIVVSQKAGEGRIVE